MLRDPQRELAQRPAVFASPLAFEWRQQAPAGQNKSVRVTNYLVESRCGAVTVGSGCLLPPLSSGGAQVP